MHGPSRPHFSLFIPYSVSECHTPSSPTLKSPPSHLNTEQVSVHVGTRASLVESHVHKLYETMSAHYDPRATPRAGSHRSPESHTVPPFFRTYEGPHTRTGGSKRRHEDGPQNLCSERITQIHKIDTLRQSARGRRPGIMFSQETIISNRNGRAERSPRKEGSGPPHPP